MAVAAATSGECSWGAAAMRARFFRSYVAGVDDARVAFLRVARSGSFMEVWLDAFCFGRKNVAARVLWRGAVVFMQASVGKLARKHHVCRLGLKKECRCLADRPGRAVLAWGAI